MITYYGRNIRYVRVTDANGRYLFWESLWQTSKLAAIGVAAMTLLLVFAVLYLLALAGDL